jgi:hypothetical protein
MLQGSGKPVPSPLTFRALSYSGALTAQEAAATIRRRRRSAC